MAVGWWIKKSLDLGPIHSNLAKCFLKIIYLLIYQNIPNITYNIPKWLYLLVTQVSSTNDLQFICPNMFSTSSSNIHHYVKTFKVDGTVQNTKNGTSQEQIIFRCIWNLCYRNVTRSNKKRITDLIPGS